MCPRCPSTTRDTNSHRQSSAPARGPIGPANTASTQAGAHEREVGEGPIQGDLLRLGEHSEAQIILVDNEPTARAADNVVVEYSADPDIPPYGVIDDEDGRKRPIASDGAQV
jgi:hypothetical protein